MTQTIEDWEVEYDRKMAAAVTGLEARWGVKHYKGHNTHDGTAFVFVLTDGGKEVASIEDSGVGGGAWASFIPAARDSYEAWRVEAERLFPDDRMASEAIIEALLIRAGK